MSRSHQNDSWNTAESSRGSVVRDANETAEPSGNKWSVWAMQEDKGNEPLPTLASRLSEGAHQDTLHIAEPSSIPSQHHAKLLETLTSHVSVSAIEERINQLEIKLNMNNVSAVPTSVLRTQEPPQPTSSSSSGSYRMKSRFDGMDSEELIARIRNLEKENSESIKEINQLQIRAKQENERAYQTMLAYREKFHQMNKEIGEQRWLRISSRERFSSIKNDFMHLKKEVEEKKEELASYKEIARGIIQKSEKEHIKCIVCYQRAVGYSLVPCFHFGKLKILCF